MVHGDFSDESSVIEVGHLAGNKGRICVFLCARHKIQISLQCRSPQPTAVKQQQSWPCFQRPTFSNWPLMCLVGNYCDNDKGFTTPGRLSYQSIQMQVVSGMQDWDRSICFV